MTKEEIKKIIDKIPNSKPYYQKSDDYKLELFNGFTSLTIKDKKLNEKIEKLLIGDNSTQLKSLFSYNQGISELLWWFFLEKNGIPYKIEKNMVPGKDTNIDVQFLLSGIDYNIEIKSPEYPIKENGNLQGRVACRVPGVDMKEALTDISNEFRKELCNTNYNDVDEDLPNDNKIKDCLLSAQKKFVNNSASNCNILFISTTDDELVHYINYFVNPYSGFFTPNSYVPHSDFDNVKAVILSNSISMNDGEIKKGWDLSNSLNLIFHNPNCKYQENSILNHLFTFLPNATQKYCQDLKEFSDQQNKLKQEEQAPIELFLLEFVNKYKN